jgi:gluconolactonase
VNGVPIVDTFNNNGNDFTNIEGPVWIGDALYISEFPGSPNPPPSRILKITAAGDVSIAIPDSGTNGLAADKSGTLYGALHKDGSVSKFNLTTGAATAIASMYMGARFDSPNDLAIRSDGNIYFSDPDYQAASTHPQSKTRLYRIAPGTNAVTVIDDTLGEPNGVTLSIDEKTLYVTSRGPLNKYPVMADGSVGTATIFSQEASSGDGMTIDCAGNLYVATNNTVLVINPSGTKIGTLTVTGPQAVTNVAFGGADHKTLYITAQGSSKQQGLFQMSLGVPGMPY